MDGRKVALITGASRGLGLEWCRQLGEKGWTVFGGCRAGSKCEALAALPNVTPVELDIADSASVAKLGAVLDGVSLHLLVNNAGIRLEECGPDKMLAELDFAAMQVELNTNTIGPMRVMAACTPALGRAAIFKVVNISSALGSCALAKDTRKCFHNLKASDLAYRTSKAGLNMATACAALELSEAYPESCVVTMDPGWVQTDMGLRGGKDSPPMTIVDSVTKQLARVEGLTPSDTGTYVSGPCFSPQVMEDGTVQYNAATLKW